MAGIKQKTSPMWKKLMKLVDLGESTSFRDHLSLGCTQRECKPNETIIDKYIEMFESRISAAATEELLSWENLRAKTVVWSYDTEGHAKKCVERQCELTNKKTEQLYRKSQFLAWTTSTSRKRKQETVGDLSKVCSQMVWKCLYLTRIGGLDILLSVNKLARVVTKWTRACDGR